MKLSRPISSKDFVNEQIRIFDSDLTYYNKTGLLNRVQFWKNYFNQRLITKIGLHYYQCLNCTAIILACLEEGVTIYTGSYSSDGIGEIASEVDVILAGFGKEELQFDKRIVWWDRPTNDPEYIPTVIDPDFVLFRNRIDTNRLVGNGAEFTAGEFLTAAHLGSYNCYAGSVATIQYTNHVDTNAVFLISPLFVDTTIYSCSHMIELAGLLRRRHIGYIGISTVHLQALKLVEDGMNADSPFGTESFKFEFKNADIVTQRNGPQKSAPSAELCDWAFSRGANSITSVYIPNGSLLPCFTKTITRGSSEYFSDELGTRTKVNYKIDNEMLHIKDHTNQWFNTNEYATEYDGRVFFKGDQKVNGQYIADVQRFMLGIVDDAAVTLSDFIIRYNNDILTVYSFRSTTHEKIIACKELAPELLNFAGIQKINYQHWDKSKVYNV